jgi:hypothetical protein
VPRAIKTASTPPATRLRSSCWTRHGAFSPGASLRAACRTRRLCKLLLEFSDDSGDHCTETGHHTAVRTAKPGREGELPIPNRSAR